MQQTILSLTALYKALGDPTRLRILRVLSGCELRVSEIVDVLEMGQSRISRHLRILVEAGLIVPRRSGVWTFYSIDETAPNSGVVAGAVASMTGEETDLRRRDAVLAARRDETRDFFDSRAGRWEAMKRHIFGSVDPDELVLECLGEPLGTVADLGCGEGSLVELLAARANRVIGVDNAQAMIEFARARHRGRESIEFRLGDIEHLPLKDGEIDAAVLSLVLHHLSQPAEAVTETARAVRSGGLIVIAEFAEHTNEALREAHGDRWLGIGPELLEAWLEGAGCTLVGREMHQLSEGIELCCVAART